MMMTTTNNNVRGNTFVPGEAYRNFFTMHRRYKIVKGSRASKKSTNIAAYILLKLLSNDFSSAICLRKTFNSISTTVYNQLQKSARMLGVYDNFIGKKNPLVVVKKSTNQKIYFLGLKEVEKLTSVIAEEGVFDTIGLEEAFEITDYYIGLKVEGSFRGYDKIEFILTFNPWAKNGIYKVFFKGKLEDDFEKLETKGWQEYIDDDMLLLITNHRINEYLASNDHKAFMQVKTNHFEFYKVVSLGCGGSVDSMVYNTLSDANFMPRSEMLKMDWDTAFVGIDYGLVNDATFCVLMCVNSKTNTIGYIEEWSHANKGLKNKKTFLQITNEVVDFVSKCTTIYPFFTNSRKSFVENQEEAFREILNSESKNRKLDLFFQRCKKEPIETRVKVFRHLMARGKIIIANECVQLGAQLRSSTYNLDALKQTGQFIRSDDFDDGINAAEYATTQVWKYLLRTYEEV